MKKLLIISLFALSMFANIQAQSLYSYPNYTKRDAVIGASIIGATFITLEIKGNDMTYGQRSITAMSGIAISAGYSLFKTTKFSRKIQRRIKLRRNKSINRNEILICKN